MHIYDRQIVTIIYVHNIEKVIGISKKKNLDIFSTSAKKKISILPIPANLIDFDKNWSNLTEIKDKNKLKSYNIKGTTTWCGRNWPAPPCLPPPPNQSCSALRPIPPSLSHTDAHSLSLILFSLAKFKLRSPLSESDCMRPAHSQLELDRISTSKTVRVLSWLRSPTFTSSDQIYTRRLWTDLVPWPS